MYNNTLFKINERGFLNKEEGIASYNVVGEIYKDKYEKDGVEQVRASCDLVISDCNRQITLDFSLSEFNRGYDLNADYENAIYKLQMLRSALDKVEKFLLKAKEINDNASVVSM
jgi:hypothetical protein